MELAECLASNLRVLFDIWEVELESAQFFAIHFQFWTMWQLLAMSLSNFSHLLHMQVLRFKAFSLLFFNEKERECVAQVHDASGENAIMWCKVVRD